MKTETKIAEENLWNLKEVKKDFEMGEITWKFACSSHKTTCQRFLEFLERNTYRDDGWTDNNIKNKITDLKNAIKKYDEAGI